MSKVRKVALVTGGSRGIGRSTAVALAKARVRVAFIYRSNEAAANQTLDALEGEGHLAIAADVADPEAVQDAVECVIGECGRLDILVNNAGIFAPDGIATATYADWQAVWQKSIGINLLSAANLSHCAVQHMKKAGGRIVFVGSRGAYRGDPGYLAYVAAKAGMKAMAQSLAIEVGGLGIFTATVAPGFVDTEMAAPFLAGAKRRAVEAQSPLKQITTADEVAKVIAFAALDAPMSMSGCVLDVNGASWLRP